MEIKYYQDIDSEAIYACVGPMGMTAIFRLSDPRAQTPKWEFLVPDSPIWDSIHQRIYRNSKVEEIVPEQYSDPLPILPAVPSGPFPQWKEYFLADNPVPVSQYPGICIYLKSQAQPMVRIFFILYEDRYESMLGDGEFHYFKEVFLTPEEACNYQKQNESEWEKLHLREMEIQLQEDRLEFPDFNPQLFDRCRIEEVLTALETRLQDQMSKGAGSHL